MDGWTYDALWQKAKLYVDRALEEERNDPLFPFWATLALELLARATLAKIHPALLAEPDCLLFAFGYDTGVKPKSLMAKTIFCRCRKVVPGFGDEELKKCMTMIDRRNEELHTGVLAFESLPTQLWLAEYYRISNLLLSFQQRSLTDFLGAQEASAAEQMIGAAQQEVIKEVIAAIGTSKSTFEALDAEEKAAGRRAASVRFQDCSDQTKTSYRCPACGENGLIVGEQVRAGEQRLRDGLMYRELAFLPTKFSCYCCGLQFEGHALLHAAGMGGQYSIIQTNDPVEYYGEQLLEALAEEQAYSNE